MYIFPEHEDIPASYVRLAEGKLFNTFAQLIPINVTFLLIPQIGGHTRQPWIKVVWALTVPLKSRESTGAHPPIANTPKK